MLFILMPVAALLPNGARKPDLVLQNPSPRVSIFVIPLYRLSRKILTKFCD